MDGADRSTPPPTSCSRRSAASSTGSDAPSPGPPPRSAAPGCGRNSRTRPRWFTRRHNRRHEAAQPHRPMRRWPTHRRACARLRRPFNPDRTTIHGSAPLWPAIAAASALVGVSGGLPSPPSSRGSKCRPGRGRGGARPLRRRLARDRHGGTHREQSQRQMCSVLSVDQTLAALGSGATQSAGMKVVYGSMGKSLHAGKAAMDGLVSGFLAREGFTSSREPIEGHRGFLHLFSPDPRPAAGTRGPRRGLVSATRRLQTLCLRLAHPSARSGSARTSGRT